MPVVRTTQHVAEVRGRVQDIASDPEKLAKVIHASPLMQQLAAMKLGQFEGLGGL